MEDERYCIMCGNVCPRKKDGGIRSNAKYCSAECRIEGKRKYNVRWVANEYKNNPDFRSHKNELTRKYASNARIKAKSDTYKDIVTRIIDKYENGADVEKLATYLSTRCGLRHK